jgi:hypothetical protein
MSQLLSDGDLIILLTAYFDESYNHRTEKYPDEPLVYTVGCWLSTAQKWLLFGKKWQLALRKAGIEFFHMTDFEARRGIYEFWSNSKRIRVLKELHSIIDKYTIFGFASSVNCTDYDELIAPTRRYAEYFGRNYYEFDARVCMLKMKDWLEDWCNQTGYDGTVNYVFADLAKQGSGLDRMFKEVLDNPELKKRFGASGTWTKGLMREVVQLQAADVVVYELNKRMVDEIKAGKNGKRHIRKSLDNMHLSKKFAPLYFNRDEMTKWIVSCFTRPRPE